MEMSSPRIYPSNDRDELPCPRPFYGSFSNAGARFVYCFTVISRISPTHVVYLGYGNPPPRRERGGSVGGPIYSPTCRWNARKPKKPESPPSRLHGPTPVTSSRLRRAANSPRVLGKEVLAGSCSRGERLAVFGLQTQVERKRERKGTWMARDREWMA
jgi:hypothetical protein